MGDRSRFGGFENGCAKVTVPAPLLAELLEQIDDPDELRLILRCFWWAERSDSKVFSGDQILSDRTVARILGLGGAELKKRVDELLKKSVARGIFRQLPSAAVFRINYLDSWAGAIDDERLSGAPLAIYGADNNELFVAYEKYIGPPVPAIGERLEELGELHGTTNTVEAIKLASLKQSPTMRSIETLVKKIAKNSG